MRWSPSQAMSSWGCQVSCQTRSWENAGIPVIITCGCVVFLTFSGWPVCLIWNLFVIQGRAGGWQCFMWWQRTRNSETGFYLEVGLRLRQACNRIWSTSFHEPWAARVCTESALVYLFHIAVHCSNQQSTLLMLGAILFHLVACDCFSSSSSTRTRQPAWNSEGN